MRKLGSRAAVAVVAVALGVVGFGGTAFATGHHHTDGDGGDAGNGGASNANCLVPLGVSAGVVGQGGSNTQCNSTAGEGGQGGDGVDKD